MKHVVPAEAGTLFRRSYMLQLGALFCITMPNNEYKYLLLSHFILAKWPWREWPYFGSIFCHSSYRCTYFPVDQVQKHIWYTVAYPIFGGQGDEMCDKQGHNPLFEVVRGGPFDIQGGGGGGFVFYWESDNLFMFVWKPDNLFGIILKPDNFFGLDIRAR